MVKIFSKIMIASLMVLGLTSCLGDGENSQTFSNDFVLVTTDNGYTMYGLSSSGWKITSPEISGMDAGDCFFASYKINTDNVLANSTFTAENFVVKETFPSLEQSHIRISQAPLVEAIDTAATFTAIANPFYWSTTDFKDKWLIPFNLLVSKGELVNISLYYDAENQQMGEDALPADTYIVDVRLTKSGIITPPATSTPVTGNAVGDLSRLRLLLGSSSSEVKTAKIIFRYYKMSKDKNNKNVAVLSYINPAGSLQLVKAD